MIPKFKEIETQHLTIQRKVNYNSAVVQKNMNQKGDRKMTGLEKALIDISKIYKAAAFIYEKGAREATRILRKSKIPEVADCGEDYFIRLSLKAKELVDLINDFYKYSEFVFDYHIDTETGKFREEINYDC